MGSGGTEWESNDTFDTDRMNQKSTFVGTGDQIDDMRNTLGAGQSAYCIESNATHEQEKYSTRNSGNTAWVTPKIDTTTYTSDFPTNDSGGSNDDQRYISAYNMPSTDRFYLMTQIEFKSSGASSTSVFGVSMIDAWPPTKSSQLMAISDPITTSGVQGTVESTNIMSSNFIPGGSMIAVWWNTQGVTVNGPLRGGSGFDANWETGHLQVTETYNPAPDYAFDPASWGTPSGNVQTLKLYYTGYN